MPERHRGPGRPPRRTARDADAAAEDRRQRRFAVPAAWPHRPLAALELRPQRLSGVAGRRAAALPRDDPAERVALEDPAGRPAPHGSRRPFAQLVPRRHVLQQLPAEQHRRRRHPDPGHGRAGRFEDACDDGRPDGPGARPARPADRRGRGVERREPHRRAASGGGVDAVARARRGAGGIRGRGAAAWRRRAAAEPAAPDPSGVGRGAHRPPDRRADEVQKRTGRAHRLSARGGARPGRARRVLRSRSSTA